MVDALAAKTVPKKKENEIESNQNQITLARRIKCHANKSPPSGRVESYKPPWLCYVHNTHGVYVCGLMR